MKPVISIILASLLVICLLGVSPSTAPARAEGGITSYYYLPFVGRQVPVNVNSGRLSLQGRNTCAVTPAGGVKCWGSELWGAGNPESGVSSRVPYDIVNLNARVIAVSASTMHACALMVNGGVKCWGENYYGQLGDGTYTHRSTPVDVIGLPARIKAISTGTENTCALAEDGSLWCWGSNGRGELGDGTTISRPAPVRVTTLSSAVRAVSIGNGICVITEAGGVKCWGADFSGTGDGTIVTIPTPIDIDGLTSGVLGLSSGANDCAITSTNQVKCWAYEWFKGADGKWSYRVITTEIPGLTDVMAVSSGWYSHCALIYPGGVKCWGENYFGQVGDGTMITRDTPVDVLGLTSGVLDMDADLEYSCAMLASGGVKCWGYNHFYQLGIGSRIPDSSPIPLNVLNFP